MALLAGDPEAMRSPPAGLHLFNVVSSKNGMRISNASSNLYEARTAANGTLASPPYLGQLAQSSGDTCAVEHHPGLQEEAASPAPHPGAGAAELQEELMQLERQVPWRVCRPRWRTQRSQWLRTLHTPSLHPSAIARCVQDFHAALMLPRGKCLQFCGAAWETLLHACMHEQHPSAHALRAVVNDFCQGVFAWLWPSEQPPMGSPRTPHLPAEDYRPAEDSQGGQQELHGAQGSPPASPFSVVQQQEHVSAYRKYDAPPDMQRDDSAFQRVGVDYDAEETDLDDSE